MFGGVSDFSCKYTHGTSTVGGGGKATVRTTVRTDYCLNSQISQVRGRAFI